MNIQNLERGNELLKLIPELEGKLKLWELANTVSEKQLTVKNENGGSFYVDGTEIPNEAFKVVKVMTIEILKKRIASYKEEFNNL